MSATIPITDRLIARRHFQIGGYLVREFASGNEAVKVPVRNRVREYLFRHHASTKLRLFSLPGPHWRFEKSVLDWFGPNSFCIAAEREIGVIYKAETAMPGRWVRWFSRDVKAGQVEGLESSRAKMLHMDFGSIMRMGRGLLGCKANRKWWVRDITGWTMIWLDFMSPICTDLERHLPMLSRAAADRPACIPLAITVMKGRENPDVTSRIAAFGSRSRYIDFLLNAGKFRDFITDGEFEYVSSAGTTMLTVMGRFVSEFSPARPEQGEPHA